MIGLITSDNKTIHYPAVSVLTEQDYGSHSGRIILTKFKYCFNCGHEIDWEKLREGPE
jgi:RNA polymerase-binding transcription factor DksA